MPKRDDIHKVMIISSGPIIIGQACEFDYSGTQACKALRKLGYEIVLANSNPATIMTDPGMAEATYIEALNVETMTEIIEKERPDALLPNLGGQTGLNLSSALAEAGVLDKYGVKIIGIEVDAIKRGEDRIAFKATMDKLGIEMCQSEPAYSVEEAEKIAEKLGYPVVIRPAYTMGGTGGGLVYNVEELRLIAARGISASFVNQILVEESVLGWEELELEVVRDAKDQKITVCFIENVDAMGVHTGDSFCTAPMLTIAPELQKRLQKYSYDIVDAIKVIGGTNVQFAHDPKTGRVVVIEINPRTSRSSALASKATGFPIALVSAMLAGGLAVVEGWEPVPVSGVENAAYYFSTYNAPDQVGSSDRRKIMVLGGGPNRIGQGIEFDYCCVHAAFSIKDEGFESIMVNCNPETVSTDYDTSDKLYFEPLTVEDVLSIYEKEKPEGVVVQFGGQTPLNIAAELAEAGVKIIGTQPEAINLAEDRDQFRIMMNKLGIPQPESGMASTLEEALEIADRIGYPLMVRPSYVLGGRGMEVVHDEEMLKHYVTAAVDISPERPILIDKFLENAIEAEADAISDGTDAYVPAVMEHIELAGIHSGDSACVIPPISIAAKHLDTIYDYTRRIAIELKVVGLMNIQYAIVGQEAGRP